MATLVTVAVDPPTGMPVTAMVYDEQQSRIITEAGELPGSREALERMNRLYREAGKELHPLQAFDLFSAAHGWKAHRPLPVTASSFPEAVELTRANLAASYGTVSGARQALLRQVSETWDRRMAADPDAFSDDEEAVAGMRPEWVTRYAREAGVRRKFTPEEKKAAVAYLDEWLAANPAPEGASEEE